MFLAMQTYQLIQYEQRVLIAYHLKAGLGNNEIGRILSIDKSVISREISRNSSTGIYKVYNANQAHKRALERKKNIGRKPIIEGSLKRKVDVLLEDKWSPEQIHGRFTLKNIYMPSHETIYKYIYQDKKEGGHLFIHLRQRHRTRYKRSNTTKKRGVIKDRISIRERPGIIEQRIRLGDWEGDTMIGKNHKSAIATMVDRTSRETKIIKLANKTSKQTSTRIIKKMRRGTTPIRSITLDNGKEFADHKLISQKLRTAVYFADPYSAFQRGTNENTNGLIRQYLPKGTDLNIVSHYELKRIENSLNNRPRKCLGYLTPREYICKTVAIKT
jgi:IS30 family transposase